jgi:spore coat protein U-like protein
VRKAVPLFAVLVALTLSSSTARAAEAVATMRVTATVVANCRVEIQPLEFEPYDPLHAHAASDLQAQSEIHLLCTRNVPTTIELDGGSYATSPSARVLGLGSERLRYNLFVDSARNRIWGIGADALVLNGVGPRAAGEPLRLTIYGTIPQAQEVIAGEYTDIVTARVSF